MQLMLEHKKRNSNKRNKHQASHIETAERLELLVLHLFTEDSLAMELT